MILFGLSLCTLVTFAFMYKGEYVECFTDEDCTTKYPESDKDYCYVGTCTNRCPPGYNQLSTADDISYICQCDEENGFVSNGNFTGAFANITKCKCNKPYCHVTVYAMVIGYTDGLVPKGAPPNCKVVLDEVPAILSKFAFYLVIATMVFLLLIHFRSASSLLYDLHRYYFLYVLGSILVIVFVQTVTPFSAGFTRSMTFGIIAHNAVEWNLLVRLQYGKTAYVRNSTNVLVLLYFVIMLVAMSLLRLDHLLYFSMVQGGFLDWTFVCFIFAAQNTVQNSVPQPVYDQQCIREEYPRFAFWYGFGAIFHLLSVEILFAGFILNNAALIGFGGFLLVPMFLFYTIWVLGQERTLTVCGPRIFMQYEKGISNSEPAKLKLTPYQHTSRVVDVLWKRFVGEGYEPIELKSLDDDKQVGIQEPVEKFGPTCGVFEVEDPELFKFGIDDECLCCCTKCPRIGTCCNNYFPCYWILTFILISVNAGIFMLLPMMVSTEGCYTGYDYGAW